MAIELYMENFSSRETLSLSPLFRSIHVILIFENNKKKKKQDKGIPGTFWRTQIFVVSSKEYNLYTFHGNSERSRR